jgi:SAM-dependent methyltransferase
MTKEIVRDFYAELPHMEWKRLVKDAYHRLEFVTTLNFLKKHLPEKGLILDAGGGPGRYTIEMASQGYEVVLFDLTRQNLDFAERQIKKAGVQSNVRGIIEGSIVDLSGFSDNSFDGILCLGGPLSHVLDAEERDRAISELVRVAKPGAPIFVSVMGRLSVLVIELIQAPFEIDLPHFQPMRDTGDYFGGSGFTCCHFFLPEELREIFNDKGVEILEMAGLEGISSHHLKKLNALAREGGVKWQRWLEIHNRTCTHPAVVGISEHMLIVSRKK